MESFPASTPFVLLDDARAGQRGRARFYRDPVGALRADRLDEVGPALANVRQALDRGLHVSGFVGYEAGYALERRLQKLDTCRQADDPPLLWFGLFEHCKEIGGDELTQLLGAVSEQDSRPVEPMWKRADYDAAFLSVERAIIAGDIYQINLTFPCTVDVGNDPLAFYRSVRPIAAAGQGALLFTGDHWLLSFSPEQFFALEEGQLYTRPMKGTAVRDIDPAVDADNARMLREDPKQQAENLMIVDLLRNDLSRIAMTGSVAVPELFTVESYPTVHQMTSTVTARLRSGLDAVDALMALFPCGSITGAPKIRAMEIIREIELQPRGPYTGAIGHFDPNGNAAFNVAIRTICVKHGDMQGVIGLGSGVVADSTAESEWWECLDKGRFLSSRQMRRAGDRS